MRGRCVDLPRYPWQRERHWHADTSECHGRLARRVVHPLLGYAVEGEAFHWENQLDLAKQTDPTPNNVVVRGSDA